MSLFLDLKLPGFRAEGARSALESPAAVYQKVGSFSSLRGQNVRDFHGTYENKTLQSRMGELGNQPRI